MEQEQQGPQNTIQFITMMITSLVKGLPQMIKSMIITSVISGVITLALHFYLILVPNDGYNSSGIPILDSILVLANIRPTPPNVLLFWFLGNLISGRLLPHSRNTVYLGESNSLSQPQFSRLTR